MPCPVPDRVKHSDFGTFIWGNNQSEKLSEIKPSLKGLFDPEDIKHARDTILYLISKQGAKATHFQVKVIADILI